MSEHAGASDEFRTGLAKAKDHSDRIAQSLPGNVAAASLTRKSKLPYKAVSLREILIHRVSALSTAAVEMFEQQRLVPAVVLTRAIVETVAVTFNLHKKLTEFPESMDIDGMDEFLMKGLVGGRQPEDAVQSMNVLTLIDHAEKTIPGFRGIYDILSEYTHPNWAGTLGAFGQTDREKVELNLGPSGRTAGLATGVFALLHALMIFEHFYNEMIEPLQEFNEHFERSVSSDVDG
jgi:hypothetical protein